MTTDNTPKQKALDLALKQIEKQFGKGSIMRLGDAPVVKVEVIPTGSLALDAALGVGGIPRGRVTEIFGPESSGKTTLAIHCIAEAQKLGGICAFIDAEHAFDPTYAGNLGVDIDNLLMSQPDTGEQALSICEMLIRSGALDLIVVDSVAALVPRAEIEGDMGDTHVGLQARLMSQALRKLTGIISRSKTALIFINQLREKIGVMWGCFQYNTRVVLADGTTEKIGKIVNQRLPVEVLSYDPQTGALEPRRVVNWFDNGVADYFLQFEVEGGPSGRRHFAATPNHTLFTPFGEVAAGDLRQGDEVLTMVADYHLTEDQWQLVLGSALGDGSLRKVSTHATMFRVRHGQAQEEYVQWKHWMLEPFSRKLGPAGNGIGFDTLSFPVLTDVRRELYAEQTARLHELIAPYLHPAVYHKLHPKLRGRFNWQPDLSDAHLNGTRLDARRYLRAVPARIKKIYVKPPTRSMRRFDLEVEGNHTYLVDGVVVHNSPEITPGGRALKFYCSVRLDIRRIGAVKDGPDVIGNRTRVKVVKNKVAPPFQQAEFDIIYGIGVSALGELVDLAVDHDIIKKSGSWYSYGETKIGQGREATKTWLQDNPKRHDEVKHRVKVVLGMEAPPADEISPAVVADEARNGIVPEQA